LPGYSSGIRSSVRRMPAAFFQEHRMYVPGDDVRFLDWKASARHEHIFIKQGEQPKEATVYVVLDCSASMTWGEPSKALAALKLAAGLSYLVLAHNDRLVFAGYAEKIQHALGPIHGKGQFPTLLNHLKGIHFSGTADLLASAKVLRNTIIGKGGLILWISDLLGSQKLDEMLMLFPPPTYDVIMIHLVHPEELNPVKKGDFELVDIENGQGANYDIDQEALQEYRKRMEAWLQGIERTCVEHNAFYTLLNSRWDFDLETIPHLRSVGVVKPL
jgi:uncharacterized protein (DUF58 family)